MAIILWFLSAVFSLYALTTFLSVLQGKAFLSFLLALIALVLVFPPLHSLISQKISWLTSKALRIFLAIILFIFSFFLLPTSERFAFEAMTVCAELTNNDCQVENTRFADQASQLFVAAKSDDPITDVELKISNKNSKTEAEIEKVYPSQSIKKGEQNYLIPVDISELEIGTYDISIAPVVEEDVISGLSKQEITVWPEQSDVTRRESGGDLAEVSSFRFLNDVKVCTMTLKEVKDETSKCSESETDMPATSEAVGFLAEINNPGKENVKLDFTFRGENKGNYTAIQARTFDVSPKDGYVMYSLTLPEGGITPGQYDVIVSMQTKEAKPIRKSFTLS